MNCLSIATFSLLITSLYINRDVVLFSERRLEYLIIGSFLMFNVFILLYSFLSEFVGIFLFLFALFLFVGSLLK